MRRQALGWFLVAQVVTCLFVFRDALWGGALLAPIDIPPALFTKYRYADPASTGVPANHHIIDQMVYDLPLQKIIHESYQRGETPWWDPYTGGGRPLLADAHVNGADPVRRLAYALLPFEAAYNWTRVAHYVLCGLGMWLLLRRLGGAEAPALWLALAYQFGGAFEVFFGHPWIQGSFVYYPFLWLAWEKALAGKLWGAALAALCLAGIFYAGNLQSHAYVTVFALSFALGRAGLNWRAWLRLVGLLGATGLLGALLAAPVLSAELELFAFISRPLGGPFAKAGLLAAPVSLSACFPWAIGTFRTLDLTKLCARDFHLGFCAFIGCAAFFLAVAGAAPDQPANAPRVAARRTALWLCVLYFFIITTPLHGFLYMRCAPLALMGVTVLAALGCQRLRERPESWRRLGRSALALAAMIAVVTNVFAFVVYPRLLPKVRDYVARKSANSPSFDQAPAMREAQVRELPAEISFRNLEALLGCAGLAAVGLFLLRPELRRSRWAWTGLLALNLLPCLMYSERGLPRHPMALWKRLEAGGPEHARVLPVLRDRPERVLELTPGTHESLFPGVLAVVYHARTAHTYAALRPPSLGTTRPAELAGWRPPIADFIYETKTRGQIAGEFRTNAMAGLARFYWADGATRNFTVTQRGLNAVDLSFAAGAAGTLVWADTFYPGWTARADSGESVLKRVAPFYNGIDIPASTRSLRLHYTPRYLPVAKKLAGMSAAAIAVLGIVGVWKPRRPCVAADPTKGERDAD